MSSSVAGDDDESAAARGPTDDADSSLTRICSHCGKRFGCGKALGGHMRIHRGGKSKATAAADNNLSSGEKISCKICGKKFESLRSVFGHMRAHPDRELRGMQSQLPCATTHDPVSSANSLSSTVSDSHNQMHDSAATVMRPHPATDLSKYLSFWSATGKRGRKGKRNAVPVSDDAVISREPRSRLFKKKMRKLSDLETNHPQEPDANSKQKSRYVSNIRHGMQLRRHGGSWNWPETRSATTDSSVTNSIKSEMVINKKSDKNEILTACCSEELYHSAEHGGRKLLQIDLNELPIMEEDEGIY